jgi:hypothetical protein
MMADILKFPDRFPKGNRMYRIPLYTDYDVELVLFCVNAFGEYKNKMSSEQLVTLDVIEVKKCIDFAIDSRYISNTVKADLTSILNSIEEVTL